MPRFYDKDKLKEALGLEQIFDLLELWGGEPEYITTGLVAQTICHNLPGNGSRKLYYYTNTELCKCYTGCNESSFDIFDLCIKVMKIQNNLDYTLYDAMEYIASYFGLEGQDPQQKEEELPDWKVIHKHQLNQIKTKRPELQPYNPVVLTRFIYPRIKNWEEEGILPQVYRKHFVGYYPGTEVLTIPHFDINNNLIGIRGRFLAEENASKYGKYLPLKVCGKSYAHPLSMSLYNLNNSKESISRYHVAIVFESEKSTMLYESYYGHDNDISVACCGSSISKYQIDLLLDLGVKELVIAFDKDFEEIGDEVFNRQKNKLLQLAKKYSNLIKISCLWDRKERLSLKSSPIDCGTEIFETLMKERIRL